MPRTTTISADKLATSETRTSTERCLRANSFAQTVTCVENSPSRPWRQCRVIRVGRLKFDFRTVRDRGIRASAVHVRCVTASHTGPLNRGTKSGGSIFVQAEHFAQVTGGLAVRERRGDRRGAMHHPGQSQGPEDRHGGDNRALGSNGKKTQNRSLAKSPPLHLVHQPRRRLRPVYVPEPALLEVQILVRRHRRVDTLHRVGPHERHVQGVTRL